MSFITAFATLYAAQTGASGFTWTATVGAAANKACITSELTADDMIVHGGVGEKGGYELQMLESDVPAVDKQQAVTLKKDGSNFKTGLEVLNFKKNNGILYVVCGDFSALP